MEEAREWFLSPTFFSDKKNSKLNSFCIVIDTLEKVNVLSHKFVKPLKNLICCYNPSISDFSFNIFVLFYTLYFAFNFKINFLNVS